MRRCLVGAVAAFSLLATPAVADDDRPLRPSVSFGAGALFPSRHGQSLAQDQAAINLEGSLEIGAVFVAVTWIRGVGAETVLPDHSFLGGKLGYVVGDWPVSPYVSAAIGNLWQTARFPFDMGTAGSASGLACELEVGAVLFRRGEVGRLEDHRHLYGPIGLRPASQKAGC
jgi:hypothetical protein